MNQVIFGTDRSYSRFGMWLTDVQISPAKPKRSTASVQGRNGLLNMSGVFGDETRFENRTIRLEFVLADYARQWQRKFSEIQNAIHGKQLQVTIEPDDDYYWDAFVTVNSQKSNKNKGTIVIDCDAYPFQFYQAETTYSVTATTSGKRQICENDRMPVIPTFTAANACTLEFGDTVKSLVAGKNQFTDVIFTEGNNEVIIKGSGTVTISYRQGLL